MRNNRQRLAPILLAIAIIAASCSSGGASNTDSIGGQVAERTAGGDDPRSLKGHCPKKIVIQSSWTTQVEHFVAYQLLGAEWVADPDHKRVTGPLVAQGVDTGVDIEIRAGGPAIGFGQVSAQMYVDETITLGMVPADEVIQLSNEQPVTGVMTPLELDPQVIMWAEDKHPEWFNISDIGQTDTTVLYFEDSTYMQYLIGSGTLRESQVDGSYDGSPARFVAEDGNIAVQGFATNEPYLWSEELPEWNKPIRYQLVSETGYPNYRHLLAVRSDEIDDLEECLKRLVPIFQQATAAFMENPEPVIELVLEVVKQTEQTSNDSAGRSRYAVQVMKDDGIVANGTNGTIGDFDPERLTELINITRPIFTGQGRSIKKGITHEDIATNRFIDLSIGLRDAA